MDFISYSFYVCFRHITSSVCEFSCKRMKFNHVLLTLDMLMIVISEKKQPASLLNRINIGNILVNNESKCLINTYICMYIIEAHKPINVPKGFSDSGSSVKKMKNVGLFREPIQYLHTPPSCG